MAQKPVQRPRGSSTDRSALEHEPGHAARSASARASARAQPLGAARRIEQRVGAADEEEGGDAESQPGQGDAYSAKTPKLIATSG